MLNATEPLWKSLKRGISPEIYEDEDHFRELLTFYNEKRPHMSLD